MLSFVRTLMYMLFHTFLNPAIAPVARAILLLISLLQSLSHVSKLPRYTNSVTFSIRVLLITNSSMMFWLNTIVIIWAKYEEYTKYLLWLITYTFFVACAYARHRMWWADVGAHKESGGWLLGPRYSRRSMTSCSIVSLTDIRSLPLTPLVVSSSMSSWLMCCSLATNRRTKDFYDRHLSIEMRLTIMISYIIHSAM